MKNEALIASIWASRFDVSGGGDFPKFASQDKSRNNAKSGMARLRSPTRPSRSTVPAHPDRDIFTRCYLIGQQKRETLNFKAFKFDAN